jgi:AcrR family transcriptional regulator
MLDYRLMTTASNHPIETGRIRQKARTRDALIRAARELLARGTAPTVEEVAAAASLSRATAYRYFPSQAELLVATYPEIASESLLGESPPADAAERLEIVTAELVRTAIEHEAELRAMLRLSLEADAPARGELPFRVGRRITWVADALSPLRGQIPEPELSRLVLAIASAVGIDALVWLTDIAGLTRPEAADVMRWSARTLLASAVGRAIAAAP